MIAVMVWHDRSTHKHKHTRNVAYMCIIFFIIAATAAVVAAIVFVVIVIDV